ncbi:MAG: hypothetical protein ACTHJW_25235 [Streptosporangiaceae bacterium]
MSFSQHLVLWLHVAFVIFTIGPVTLAIMSTPRYIRKRDIRILRYLARMTLIFGIGSVGVLIVGIVLSSMIGKTAKPWIIISETLFVVTILLLGLIQRDQRKAIKALEAAAATAASVTAPAGQTAALAGSVATGQRPSEPAAQPQPAQPQPAQPQPAQPQPAQVPAQAQEPEGTAPDQASGAPAPADGGQLTAAGGGQAPDAAAFPAHMANVERGRIAMIGGVVTVIWLVVLVLMVWNG